METNNYYIIQTEENKEFAVQSKLRDVFPKFDIVIPTEETVVSLNGRKFLYHNRLMPDYVFLGCSLLSKIDAEKISKIKDVVGIMINVTSSGPQPCFLEKDEVKRFIEKPNKRNVEIVSMIKNLADSNSSVNVLYGQYAGYSGKVKSITEDKEVIVMIENKSQAKVKLPIWYLGHELVNAGV